MWSGRAEATVAPAAGAFSGVCVISTVSGLARGGLSTYVRLLTARLAASGRVTTVARFERDESQLMSYAGVERPRTLDQGGGAVLTIIALPSALRPFAGAAQHLIHRPGCEGVAAEVVVRAYTPHLARAVPDDVRLVHWVGTGRELLGFAALRVARRRQAAFTVLPGIHEGSWGDGTIDGRLYAAADRVFALSSPETSVLGRLGVEAAKIEEIGLGPAVGDEGNGAAFREHHKLGKRPMVLFIGRKERPKGYHALCEAMRVVQGAVPAAVLVAIGPCVAGEDPVSPSGCLLDLGATGDREKADALAACDVLCVASTGESFGLVCVEAWRYGKPVIVGPSSASRDLVKHGVTGLHVDQRAEDIADALLKLLAHPETARAMGARGRALQRSRYTWEMTWRRHAEGFERAAATARASRLGP